MPRKNSPTEKNKTKRSKAKKDTPDTDLMSHCVSLCQEQRWREALLLCRQACQDKGKGNNADSHAGLLAAQEKIDRSLRRQMTAALIDKSAELLEKEYLLDVSE